MLTVDEPPRPRHTTDFNRRREQRVPLSRRVSIQTFDADARAEFVEVEICDCSEHGLSFYFDRAIPIDTEFMLRIQFDETQFVQYRVRNCARLQYDSFRIGAEFAGYIAVSKGTTRQSIVDAIRSLPT